MANLMNAAATAEETDNKALTERLKAYALTLGFDACGVARVDPEIDPDDIFGAWLAAGYHADMTWLERTKAMRQNPRLHLPGAESVVVVAHNYYTRGETGKDEPSQTGQSAKVARYAWGRDYHRVMPKRLHRLGRFLQAERPGSEYVISVDAGPFLERAWAARAGIGWIGKNSLVLRRDLGSWFFLGLVLTTVELVPDAALPEACGSCRACIDACPTGAIVSEKIVDSRRCISYHTIENSADIPRTIQTAMGPWIFGCDICQEVCPWNRFARETAETDYTPRIPGGKLDPIELLRLSEDEFDRRFSGSPLRRAKYRGMRRNASIIIRNLGMAVPDGTIDTNPVPTEQTLDK